MKPLSLVRLLTLVPVLAFASLENPFENQIQTPVNPHFFAKGLCPGAPLEQIPSPVQALDSSASDADEIFRRDLRLQMAMYSSNLVYNLPDLEVARSGRQLVDQVKPFLQALPKGYEPYSYYSDPEAGMKFMILAPRADLADKGPWILSIAGTQSALDILSDLDLGWNQLQKVDRLTSLFTTCQFLGARNRPLASYKWIFTGHSLGGALAQAFAYKVQKERLAHHLMPLNLELVTFNAFGGQELVSQDEAYDPQVSEYLKARNYFVEGDAVSRIGTHIGPTYELKEKEGSHGNQNPMDLYRHHSMDRLIEMVSVPYLLLSPLSMAPEVAPPTFHSKKVRKVLKFSPKFRSLARKLYQREEAKNVKVLQEAADYLMTLDLQDPVNQRTLFYVQRLTTARIESSSDQGAQALQAAYQMLTTRAMSLNLPERALGLQ